MITSLATVIPFVGKNIVYWLWGGFSIDHPTLNRFYSFHYTLPFLLAGLSIFHIAALHQYGSTNPLGVNSQTSSVPFGTYFVTKDGVGLLYLALAFCILVFFYPEWLGHLAVLINNNHHYNMAICWNLQYTLNTKQVLVKNSSNLKNALLKTKTKTSFLTEQSAGHKMLHSKVGSSETTCHTSNYEAFNSWLAGLIDGDGSSKHNRSAPRTGTYIVTSFELTLATCTHCIKFKKF